MAKNTAERLTDYNLNEYAEKVMIDIDKNRKDNSVIKQLVSTSYLKVIPTNSGQEKIVWLIAPYSPDGVSFIEETRKFGSNEIQLWAYFFKRDELGDGTVKDDDLVWLPINPPDFANSLLENCKESYDTVISMLGISMASALCTDKSDYTGYMQTLESINDFNAAARFAYEDQGVVLVESSFDRKATITKVFSSVSAYMLAATKQYLNPKGNSSLETPFVGTSSYNASRRSNSRTINGFSRRRNEKAGLSNVLEKALSKGK